MQALLATSRSTGRPTAASRSKAHTGRAGWSRPGLSSATGA